MRKQHTLTNNQPHKLKINDTRIYVVRLPTATYVHGATKHGDEKIHHHPLKSISQSNQAPKTIPITSPWLSNQQPYPRREGNWVGGGTERGGCSSGGGFRSEPQFRFQRDLSLKSQICYKSYHIKPYPSSKTMATKEDSVTKNVAVAYDESHTSNEDDATKDKGIKKADVIASDHNNRTSEKQDVMKNKVAASDNTDRISEEDSDEDEKDAGVDLGVSLEKLNLGPKKKLLVLPIGGFLVHRAHRRRPKTVPRNRKPDFCSGNFMIYKRPFCEEFLKFCFERFEVGIWSSAMEHNIGEVLTNIMGELKTKLLFTWDQKHCTETDYMCLDDKYKPIFLKELDHLWSKKYMYLPWSEGDYSASNTLLITDPVKALLNPPNTAIFLGDYNPRDNRDDFLGPNGGLRMFLDGLAEAKDVQTYVKAHPFGVQR